MTLTAAEQAAQQRAHDLLQRTHYDADAEAPERVTDARAVAHALLETLAALGLERSARVALQARCEEQQAILGKAAYQACYQRHS